MFNIKIESYNNFYKDQIIQLILKIQTEEFGIAIAIEDQPDLEQIPKFYQKGKGNFWVALDNKHVIGTIALIDLGNGQAALRKMFVDKSYRGKEIGVAQALLNEVITWCKNKQICEIYLGTTSAFLAAHRFYEKNGFQEILKDVLPPTFSLMQVDSKFYMKTVL